MQGEGRPGGGTETANKQLAKATTAKSNGLAAWKRRHAAARRVVSLDCGCRDPWPCRCTQPPLSEQRIDAGRDSAIRLLALGYVPILEIEVLQALWRRGGVERELAESLFDATGGAIA